MQKPIAVIYIDLANGDSICSTQAYIEGSDFVFRRIGELSKYDRIALSAIYAFRAGYY